jgi:hypothetical protein
LEYLAGRVQKLQEFVKRVCEERIECLASRCAETL